MLHDDITEYRLIVYAQSIEHYKLRRMSRNLKRSGFSDQEQTRFKKRDQGQEKPVCVKVKLEKRGGSQNSKPTCVTCLKRDYGEVFKGYHELIWLW